jgi:hypothetical protein
MILKIILTTVGLTSGKYVHRIHDLKGNLKGYIIIKTFIWREK